MISQFDGPVKDVVRTLRLPPLKNKASFRLDSSFICLQYDKCVALYYVLRPKSYLYKFVAVSFWAV